ncbi:hypothetical protein HMPREF1544_08767, partial [Mucor circinelloides 1006PhL]
CKLCKRNLSETESYKKHLYGLHNMDCRLPHQKPQDVIPDFNDRNYYCPPCNRSLLYLPSFLRHLERAHAMYTEGPQTLIPVPNINDDNNSCRICRENYSCKREYRRHLHLAHLITLSPFLGDFS